MTRKQYKELASEAFANALDLQKASRVLFKHGHFAATVALAVVSDEEMAKSLLFAIAATDTTLLPNLDRLLLNHRAKQGLVAYFAQYADAVGPALRAVGRIAARSRQEAPHADQDHLKARAQDEALRVIRERMRRRLTAVDRAALLAAGDIQTTKNNCLYVGLDSNGSVTVPQRVATRSFAKAYLAALDNRLHFYTFLVLGNVKDGLLELGDADRRLIADAWRRFAGRFRKRRRA